MGSASLTSYDSKSGYLQSIDLDTLLETAKRKDVVIETIIRPGNHLICGCAVAQVWGTASLLRQICS